MVAPEGKQLPVLQPGKNAGQPPVFQRVGIVGLGLIGGSIALAARDIWPAGLVIGVDRKDVLERAMVRHAIDVAADVDGRQISLLRFNCFDIEKSYVYGPENPDLTTPGRVGGGTRQPQRLAA